MCPNLPRGHCPCSFHLVHNFILTPYYLVHVAILFHYLRALPQGSPANSTDATVAMPPGLFGIQCYKIFLQKSLDSLNSLDSLDSAS